MSNFIETVKNAFKKEKIVNARTAYYRSRYGKMQSDDEMLKEMLEDINDSIKYKCSENKYCAMFEINEDREKFIPSIVDQYKEAGYQTILIKNDTKLDGKVLNNLTSMFLILIWNNLKVIEDNETNETNVPVSDYSENKEAV